MPTKKKRVGFIPREEVMKIIDKLSLENNLSNSKIINILVEEALSIRGIFNKKTGKENRSNNEIKEFSKYLNKDSAHAIDNESFKLNTESENYINSDKRNLLKQVKEDEIDLQTYKNFLSFLKFQEMIEKYNT